MTSSIARWRRLPGTTDDVLWKLVHRAREAPARVIFREAPDEGTDAVLAGMWNPVHPGVCHLYWSGSAVLGDNRGYSGRYVLGHRHPMVHLPGENPAV